MINYIVGNKLNRESFFVFSIGFCLLVALGAERLLHLLQSWNSTSKVKTSQFQPRPPLRPPSQPQPPSCKTRSSSQSSMGSTSTTSSSKCGRTTKIRRRLRRARTRQSASSLTIFHIISKFKTNAY